MRICITGANGFVGYAACVRALAAGMAVHGTTRKNVTLPKGVRSIIVPDINGQTHWGTAVADCNVVLHTAAHVHVIAKTTSDLLTTFHRVNVEGTLNLARQAAAAGVQRFLFLSTIKVNGESTALGHPFNADSPPYPCDAYAISKYKAEIALRDIAVQTGMELVIIRPPLVYGQGVKSNFATMIRYLSRGVPLPLGAITYNQRSLVALDNLVDLLISCIDHPLAAHQTFLVSDDEDVSTTDLLRRIGHAMGKPTHLFSLPPSLLQLGARLLGKGNLAQRLLGNLQVNINKTKELLCWTPPISVDEGLRKSVQAFIR